jgi:hypothetical protein
MLKFEDITRAILMREDPRKIAITMLTEILYAQSFTEITRKEKDREFIDELSKHRKAVNEYEPFILYNSNDDEVNKVLTDAAEFVFKNIARFKK